MRLNLIIGYVLQFLITAGFILLVWLLYTSGTDNIVIDTCVILGLTILIMVFCKRAETVYVPRYEWGTLMETLR